MSTSPVKKHRTPAEWKALLERQEQSGLSQREYCSRAGISLSSFSRARRKLHAQRSAFVELPTRDQSPMPQADRPSADQGGLWSLEVALPNGCLLRFRG